MVKKQYTINTIQCQENVENNKKRNLIKNNKKINKKQAKKLLQTGMTNTT